MCTLEMFIRRKKSFMTRSFSYLSKIFHAHNNSKATSRRYKTLSSSTSNRTLTTIAGTTQSSLPGLNCSFHNFYKESRKSSLFQQKSQDFKLSLQKFRSEHFIPGNELVSGPWDNFKCLIRFRAQLRFVTSRGCLETGFVAIVQNRRDMTLLL